MPNTVLYGHPVHTSLLEGREGESIQHMHMALHEIYMWASKFTITKCITIQLLKLCLCLQFVSMQNCNLVSTHLTPEYTYTLSYILVTLLCKTLFPGPHHMPIFNPTYISLCLKRSKVIHIFQHAGRGEFGNKICCMRHGYILPNKRTRNGF